jgi:type II restriction/modification system DNA methylase subunit YeeA
MYWLAEAGERLRAERLSGFGLVSTNSIRGGANRAVLQEAVADARIFDAWDDEEWILNGAAVRVSLVCVDRGGSPRPRLDGVEVEEIHTDLTARGIGSGAVDLTRAARLNQNRGVAFMGDTKGGAFDVPGTLAREWLRLPLNPNGRPNADVLRQWMNGMDVTRRPAGKWIIDFGWQMSEADAALYEAPFAHARAQVKPQRDKNKRESYRLLWWRHVEARQGMWAALAPYARFIATPTVAKHRLFIWLDRAVCPDHQLIATARNDDTTFGILHSRFHELWSLRMGTWLGVGNDPRYTPSTTFETFPFPEGLTPDIPAADYAVDPRAQAIAAAAADVNAKREAWLNPPDLVVRVPEVVPGYPDRILPVNEAAAEMLRKRTLTNLYNQRPAWLDHAHRRLDEAVADAYGWGDDWRAGRLDDDEILARLFALNQARTAAQAGAPPDTSSRMPSVSRR